MKTLKRIITCAFFSLSFLYSTAQHFSTFKEPNYNKPKLFADLPEKLDVEIKDLESLFAESEGKHVKAPIGSFYFQGTVVSKSDPADEQVKSVVIKSSNRLGAAFTFTKIVNENGSFSYKGRMLSRDHSDAFEMQLQNGQYSLVKKHQLEILNE